MCGMDMLWVILIWIQLELVLKMFLHVCSGLLPIFIWTWLPADMFKLDWWATSVWTVGSLGWQKPMVLSVSLAEKITKHIFHFIFDCPIFKPNFDSLWCNLFLKLPIWMLPMDFSQISQFITNLDRSHKILLLLGCLRLPFDNTTVTSIDKFIASAVGKLYKIRTENAWAWGSVVA